MFDTNGYKVRNFGPINKNWLAPRPANLSELLCLFSYNFKFECAFDTLVAFYFGIVNTELFDLG